MSKQLQNIRDTVDLSLEAKGLDSTRSLKFGCVVKVDNKNLNHPEHIYCGVDLHNDNNYISLEPDGDCVSRGLDMVGGKYTEIIGRDITLEDVLLAIQQKYGEPSPVFYRVGHMGQYELEITAVYNVWQLGLPLHLQSPETITFINELISKQHG